MSITKVVSPEIQSLIDQANATFGKGFEIVRRIYDLAVGEGFTPMEARDLILDNVTAFKKSTLYSYIPDEAKDEKQRNRRLGHRKAVPKLEPESKPADRITIPESHEIIDADSESEPPSAVAQWQAQKQEEPSIEPFTVETSFEIKGVEVPVIVEVVPDKKTVFVRLDEAKARRLGL